MNVNNLTDLENLEGRIRIELSNHDLDEVLVAVRESAKDREAFVLAAISLFSIRFSHPPIIKTQKAFRVSNERFNQIYHLVKSFVLAEPVTLRELYEKYKQPNRVYAAYDFNPLFVFPFVRPWIKTSYTSLDEDRLIAPVPNLVLYRLSEGVYQQLFNKYGEDFARYFGFLFENYVGEILSNCVESSQIISAADVRKTYQEKYGKVPDWIIIEGDTATLIECKAVGFNRKALATSDERAIDYSISPILKGLIQLHEFANAIQKKQKGLEQLSSISKFNLRVITYESFHLINSYIFRDIINAEIAPKLAAKSITISDWHILSINELERVQPHMKQGISFNKIIDMLKVMEFNEVIEELHAQTNKTFEDSFLMVKHKEIFKDLGLPY